MFELEATTTSLHINNTDLSEILESQDYLVGDLNNRVAMFEEDRVVLKVMFIQLHMEMGGEPPGNTNVTEDLKAAKDGEIDLGFC